MPHVQYLQLQLRCANPRGVPVDKSIGFFDILRVFLQFRLNFHQLIHDGLMGSVRAMVIEWVVIHEWVPRVGWFIPWTFSITIWQFGWFGGTPWYTHFRNETNHWKEMGTKKKIHFCGAKFGIPPKNWPLVWPNLRYVVEIMLGNIVHAQYLRINHDFTCACRMNINIYKYRLNIIYIYI